MRRRVWQLCSLGYDSICIDVDTTVSTVYGAIEGSRKGHNTKHRGKKGLRPVFLFIEETREYLCGTQRSGTTMTDKEMARLIRDIRKLLAGHQQITAKSRQEGVREGEMGDAIKEASIVNHTIRIARLKMLFIAAKIVTHERKATVKYSEHDERAAGIMDFMEYLDKRRSEPRPWVCAA